jgi:hypothetical protein
METHLHEGRHWVADLLSAIFAVILFFLALSLVNG